MSSRNLDESRLYLTNNYSILSKYSASKEGYFEDPILEEFLEYAFRGDPKLFTRRTSQVNLGYAARQMAVDHFVKQHLQVVQPGCIIILGAGYDTLSLRPHPFDCHWIEIDLPNVIEAKLNFVKDKIITDKSEIVVSNDESVVSFIRSGLHLVSCDLRNRTHLIERLWFVFQNIPVEKRDKVTIINEVCLCYLEKLEVELILESIRNLLMHEQTLLMNYLGFEQVRPSESDLCFAQVMSKHFNDMGFPLRNFPTRDKLLELFIKKLKFRDMTIIPMYQIFHNILMPSTPNKDLRDRQPFDEYEELDLYLSHYAIVMGQCNLRLDFCIAKEDLEMSETDNLLVEGIRDMSMGQRSGLEVLLRPSDHISRFGQASCVIEDNPDGGVALFTCGYGTDIRATHGRKNQKMDDCALLIWDKTHSNLRTETLRHVPSDRGSSVATGRMHGQVCHLENDLFFFDGGRHNPNTTDLIDNSFIGRMDKSRCEMSPVEFISNMNSFRWRHRTLKLSRDKLIQIGGIKKGLIMEQEGALGLWDLSSDKLSLSSVINHQASENLALSRHSFGADLRDSNSLLIFGGLVHSWPFDRPVNSAQGALVLDLRCPDQPLRVASSAQGYDLHVHFLNQFQFVKYGGISTATGLPEECVELYDLRWSNQGDPVTKSKVSDINGIGFIPIKMTSVHFKQSREIVSIGGGGTFFTFGSQFNSHHQVIRYDVL